MMDDKTFAEILNRIREEDGSVRVLHPPWRRALMLIPLWILLVALVLSIFGLRIDYRELGGLATWGFSATQLVLALGLAILALRTVIPGALPAVSSIFILAVLTISVHVVFALMSNLLSPSGANEGDAFRLLLVCLGVTSVLGSVPLMVFAKLAKKGMPLQPTACGLLLGICAGLSAEAAWRMHCPVTSMDHVLSSHSLAILVLTLAGFLFGSSWRKEE